MMKKILFFFVFLYGCSNQSTIPKPQAFLYNELTEPDYVFYESNCGYSFFVNPKNDISSENCNIKIKNSSLNSTIYLSQVSVKNNFNLIDSDFIKKINENSTNAFSVNVSEFNDIENKVLYWGGSQWGKSFSEQFSGEEIIKCFNQCRFGGFLKERIINFIEELRRSSVEI